VRRIALSTLLYDRPKLLAALLGVSLATTLAFVQIGLYRGFELSASTVIEHIGGDLWVVPKGIEVIDNAQGVSVGPRNLLMSHPCVKDVRAVLYGFVIVQKPSGTRTTALVVAAEPRPDRTIPWAVTAGRREDLDQPLRVSVDRTDLRKLEIPADPIGATFEISSREVAVAMVTEGIRSFTLNPYLFTSLANARRFLGLSASDAMYYTADLVRPECAPDVARWMQQQPDVQIVSTPMWMKKTEAHWVGGSGAGVALGFTAVLGLVVGGVIVSQTLYSMTKEHLVELATLKALGARATELAGFVFWQVAFLAAVGGLGGLALASLLRNLVARSGLNVVLSPGTVLTSAVAILVMCVAASLMSVWTVVRVEPAEVLR
jgi:putative ABC transport system permease protein